MLKYKRTKQGFYGVWKSLWKNFDHSPVWQSPEKNFWSVSMESQNNFPALII